jgi:hypothetical protein
MFLSFFFSVSGKSVFFFEKSRRFQSQSHSVIGAGYLALTGGCAVCSPCFLHGELECCEGAILRSDFELQCNWHGILDASGRPLLD